MPTMSQGTIAPPPAEGRGGAVPAYWGTHVPVCVSRSHTGTLRMPPLRYVSTTAGSCVLLCSAPRMYRSPSACGAPHGHMHASPLAADVAYCVWQTEAASYVPWHTPVRSQPSRSNPIAAEESASGHARAMGKRGVCCVADHGAPATSSHVPPRSRSTGTAAASHASTAARVSPLMYGRMPPAGPSPLSRSSSCSACGCGAPSIAKCSGCAHGSIHAFEEEDDETKSSAAAWHAVTAADDDDVLYASARPARQASASAAVVAASQFQASPE